MTYPSGEAVVFDYSATGEAICETPLQAEGTRGPTAYRVVDDMSVRGQVSSQRLGNQITEIAECDDSTGLARKLYAFGLADAPPTGCAKPNPYLVREDDYTYDHLLNLAKQQKQFVARDASGTMQFAGCTPAGVTITEIYENDDLQRLTKQTRSWTGMAPAPGTTSVDSYGYDDLGNITAIRPGRK